MRLFCMYDRLFISELVQIPSLAIIPKEAYVVIEGIVRFAFVSPKPILYIFYGLILFFFTFLPYELTVSDWLNIFREEFERFTQFSAFLGGNLFQNGVIVDLPRVCIPLWWRNDLLKEKSIKTISKCMSELQIARIGESYSVITWKNVRVI